jgi:hypothetical protein
LEVRSKIIKNFEATRRIGLWKTDRKYEFGILL